MGASSLSARRIIWRLRERVSNVASYLLAVDAFEPEASRMGVATNRRGREMVACPVEESRE